MKLIGAIIAFTLTGLTIFMVWRLASSFIPKDKKKKDDQEKED